MKKLFITPIQAKNFLFTGCISLLLTTVKAQQNPLSNANDLLSSMKKQMDATAKKNTVSTHESADNSSTGFTTAKTPTEDISSGSSSPTDSSTVLFTASAVSNQPTKELNAEIEKLARRYIDFQREYSDYLWKSMDEIQTRILDKDEEKHFQHFLFDKTTIGETLLSTVSDVAQSAITSSLLKTGGVSLLFNIFSVSLKNLSEYYETEEFNQFIRTKNSFADLFASEKESFKLSRNTTTEGEIERTIKLILDVLEPIGADKKSLIISTIDHIDNTLKALSERRTSKKTYLSIMRMLFTHLDKKCKYRVVMRKETHESLNELCQNNSLKDMDFPTWDITVLLESYAQNELLSEGFKKILTTVTDEIFNECRRENIKPSFFDIVDAVYIRYSMKFTKAGVPSYRVYSGIIAKAYRSKHTGNTDFQFEKINNEDCITFDPKGYSNGFLRITLNPSTDNLDDRCDKNYFHFFKKQAEEIVSLVSGYGHRFAGHYAKPN